MKKAICSLLVSLLFFSLLGCQDMTTSPSGDGQTTTTTTTATPSAEIQATLMGILNNQTPFTVETGEQLYLCDYRYEIKGETALFTPIAYTLVDMNADGQTELIAIDAEPRSSYLVFHAENGTVYGHYFRYQDLLTINQNGEFMNWEADNINCHLARLKFDKTTCELDILADSFYYGPDHPDNHYEIGGKAVSKQEFDAFYEAWNPIPITTWEPFTYTAE